MPSPLKSACTIEYMPPRPTLFPETDQSGGVLKSGSCSGITVGAGWGLAVADTSAGEDWRFAFLCPAGLRSAETERTMKTTSATLENLLIPIAENETITSASPLDLTSDA